MKHLFTALLIALVASACIPVLQSRYLTQEDISMCPKITTSGGYGESKMTLPAMVSFLPDTQLHLFLPLRYLRVNVHWMNTPDTTFSLTGTGLSSSPGADPG